MPLAAIAAVLKTKGKKGIEEGLPMVGAAMGCNRWSRFQRESHPKTSKIEEEEKIKEKGEFFMMVISCNRSTAVKGGEEGQKRGRALAMD